MDLGSRRHGVWKQPHNALSMWEAGNPHTRGCPWEASGCCSDTLICYDPHCALPTCDSQPIQDALTYGLSPCDRPAMAGPTCPTDMCIAQCGASCFADVPCPDACCTASCEPGPTSECLSMCNGYTNGTEPCTAMCCGSQVDAWHAFALNALPGGACCAAPACPDVTPCTTASACMATPQRLSPSEEVSSQSNSTPCSTPMHPTWDDHKMPALLSCEWDNCGVHAATLEALAMHVRETHAQQAEKWQAVLQADPACAQQHAQESTLPGKQDVVPPADSREALELLSRLAYGTHPEPFSDFASACSCPPPMLGKEKHACGWEACEASFATHAALTEHIARDHIGSGKNVYECRWVGCKRAEEGRTFSQRQKVLRHMQTHTGDRPYECPVCARRFSEMTTLTQHIRTHTQERPYKCDFPGCDKSFSVAGSLTIHRRTHTGDKPFVCPVPGCGKQFAESSNLNKHMRVHRGDKPFACPECGKAFARLDQVTRHRQIHARRAPRAPPARAR